jgi:CBS domain-containing protein
MSKPTTVGPDITLAEVERILERTGFNGLPVVQGDALVGFVADRMAPCASVIGCGPALLDFMMRELDELRAPTVGLAEASVLEIRFGTGFNLPTTGPA